ncbi:hypothetical protein ACFCXS_12820 [Streptomyces sp. NPDC056373]|uniref:hypothetical protein n=1 Tax=Streptomyces sp. NPDC056373 TaxID=3345798 RepID=UPI0035E25681
MGIRTFLSRTGPDMAPQPVPAFEAAASTVRVPATFGSALRHATAGLRQRLAAGGRRSAISVPSVPSGSSADLAATTALPGEGGLSAAPALAGVDEVRLPGTPGTQGNASRPWARLARDCLTLVLTLLPRPRPAHTTITVYITTTDGVVSERPGGSAP